MKEIGLSLFVCCMILVCSCATIRNLREVSSTRHVQKVSSLHFTALSGKDAGIHMDGYYLTKVDRPFGRGTKVLVFYDNGTVAQYYINKEKQSDTITDFSQVVLKPQKNHDVGPYKIINDTLYVNLYRKDFISGLEIYRYYFRIVNRDSLHCFYMDCPQQVFDGRIQYRDESIGYKFVKAINLQKPRDYFLRKQEWMWGKRSEWEDYMNTYNRTK